MLIAEKQRQPTIISASSKNSECDSQKVKAANKFLFAAIVAVLLQGACKDWTSLSVICFGVCELEIRCEFAQLRDSAQAKG